MTVMKASLKKTLKSTIPFLPYFGLALIVVLPWFFRSGYLFFTDFISGPVLNINWFNSSVISDLFLKFFNLFLPHDLSQKLFITAVLLLLVLAGKRLASILLPKKPILVFLVSAFLIFNPFIYDRLGYGQFGVISAMGFMILSFSSSSAKDRDI